MRFLKLTMAYDGGAYAGWQVQPDQRTIQGELERGWTQVTGESVRAIASGRTDAGVHALGQVVSLRTASHLPCDTLRRAVDANLPHDISVLTIAEAPDGFHAIRDAVNKRYRYQILDGPVCDVIARHFVWHVRQRLDEEAMGVASQCLKGRHDFSSFEAAGASRATSVRNVTDVKVIRHVERGFDRIKLEVAADGFLYNMVRNIVGTLVEVGRNRRDAEWVREVLHGRDRRNAGPAAPPHGLFLVRVDY